MKLSLTYTTGLSCHRYSKSFISYNFPVFLEGNEINFNFDRYYEKIAS